MFKRIGGGRMKTLKFFAVTLMLWPYLGIALLYLPGEAARYFILFLYLLLTAAVYGMNIVNACRWKGEAERLAFWNMLIKLVHIPFHLLLFLLGLLFILAMVVPALLFVSPILVMIFSVISWLLVLTSSVYGINAIVRGRKMGALSTKAAVLLGILHLLFVTDVIASVIVFVRLRRDGKRIS